MGKFQNKLFYPLVAVSLFTACTHVKPLDDRPLGVQTRGSGVKAKASRIGKTNSASRQNAAIANSKKVAAKSDPCQAKVEQIALPLAKLRSYLKKTKTAGIAWQVSMLRTVNCQSRYRTQTLSLFDQLAANRKSKIGLILPDKTEHDNLVKAVEQGVQQAFVANKMAYPSIVVSKKAANPDLALRALAELVFDDQVSLIISGLDTPIAKKVIDFTQGFGLVSLILHKDISLVKDNPNAFIVYPNEYDLAQSLAEQANKRQIRKISILRPSTGKSDNLISYFLYSAKKSPLQIDQNLTYVPGDYESMSQAIELISHTSKQERLDEYQDLEDQAKEAAKKKGVAFDSRQIILPAKLSCDAIFIPDHFRMLKYFVKLLRYQQVDKIMLMGAQEWRSTDLTTPWDNLLAQAFFVDYVGNYRTLPNGIRIKSFYNDYLIPDEEVAEVDFQLIGYRAASIAIGGLFAGKSRVNLASGLLESKDLSDHFSVEKNFYGNRISRWPTFVFSLARSGINLIGRKSDATQALGRRLLHNRKG